MNLKNKRAPGKPQRPDVDRENPNPYVQFFYKCPHLSNAIGVSKR